MKHLFVFCTLAPLLLTLSVARSQTLPPNEPPHIGKVPDDPETSAAVAALDKRINQCFQLRNQGVAALKKNEVKKAETLFKQALSFFPEDGEAGVRLAEIHIRAKQPSAVAADLEHIVNPRPGAGNSVGSEITTRMLYVLAQLDCGNWGAAAECYLKIPRSNFIWSLPGGGPAHPFPNVAFTPENPDFLGMRTQAHLILGAAQSHYVEQQDAPAYMLEHLRQALKYDPRSLDATYLCGFMLAKMERFPEARTAYEKAMRMASKEARPEIQQSLDALKVQEEAKRTFDAAAKARQKLP